MMTPIDALQSTPHLRRQGDATQLIVDGEPFLVLGGELHNSSSSSLEYMRPIWDRLVAFNLNTVLAAVSWELVEPQEGVFDFDLVDGLVRDARQHGLHLILLWFGSWKNGTSSYVPAWVKRDTRRFPRARLQDGRTVEVLSTLAEANWQADARAFAALMSHLRDVDGNDHTVLMIQVENEVGLLSDSRDHSYAADQAFLTAVPQELMYHLQRHQSELGMEVRQNWESAGNKESGTWEEVFGSGPSTDELFMAWNYALYVDAVAAAGKAQHDLPMYVNAWLNGPSQKPGDWPSGGPLPHVLDVWLAGAPHIDLLAPDIYQSNFQEWCQRYTRRGNPLFIPEMRREEDGPRNVFYAIGQHAAIGVSPFAIDSLEPAPGAPLARNYHVLKQTAPIVAQHQGTGEMCGFVLDAEHPSTTRNLGGYELEISLDNIFGLKAERGAGLVIASGPDEFIGAGFGFRVAFRSTASPATQRVGIAAVDEGEYVQGQWTPGRRLNGDETWGGDFWRFPDYQPDLPTSGAYALGAGSGISHCTVYRYE